MSAWSRLDGRTSSGCRQERSRILRHAAKNLGVEVPSPGFPGLLHLTSLLFDSLLDDYRRTKPFLWELLPLDRREAFQSRAARTPAATGSEAPVPTEEHLRTLQLKKDLLLELSLSAGEHIFGITAGSEPVERIFEIRRHLYEGVFSVDRKKEKKRSSSPIVRSRRDLRARYADLGSIHLELADVLVYLDFSYLSDFGNGNRIAEYALIVSDLTQRAVGHSIGRRLSWRGRKVNIRFKTPIDLPDGTLPFARRVRKTHRILIDQLS